MKKIYLFAFALGLFTATACSSLPAIAQQQAPDTKKDTATSSTTPAAAPIQVPGPEKKYILRLTAQEITLLSQVIDASSAPHVTVMGITKVINEQLMPQVRLPETGQTVSDNKSNENQNSGKAPSSLEKKKGKK